MKHTADGSAPTLWRTPGVLTGFLGILAIAVAVMTPGFVPNASLDFIVPVRWLRRVLRYQVGRVLMAVGLILLFRSWIVLRPARAGVVNHAAILALWSVPFLLVPPVFSSDAFLYADQGWILHRGLNPYEVGLAQAGGPFAINVHPIWRGTTAVYPPLALEVQHLVTWATGFQGLISVIAMRVPALVGVAVIAWTVPRIARELGVDPQLASWFGVLNPLLLLHFVGGMHNDVPMVALVALAVWLTLRFGRVGMIPAAALVGAGAAFKQPGILAAVAIGLIPIGPRLKPMRLGPRVGLMAAYCSAAVAIAAGTFAAITAATGLGYGWMSATKIHELTWGLSPASMIEQVIGPPVRWITRWNHGLLPFLTRVTTVVSVLVTIVLAWRYFFCDHVLPRLVRHHSLDAAGRRGGAERRWDDHPLRWLAWALTAFGLGGAGFHVWYLMWGGLYLGMLRYSDRVFRGLASVMIMFIVVEAGVEYYGLRPVPGYPLGAAIGWLFWANTPGMMFNRPGTEPAWTTGDGPSGIEGDGDEPSVARDNMTP
ncbi:polyprenol phosphomannose-dependent alpha 1,6 mannosyltransferase MptB [Mariniluteicoccus flavus]